jgi:hypothetical protein
MNFIIIALIILALYIKSLKYNYVIDDYVRREEYLWNVPKESQHPKFFDTRPSEYYRLFMIGMHIVNSLVVYLLWGWQASLLFAVHPMSAWGVAWVTGNYYATTAYFTLIAYFFLVKMPLLIGVPAGMIFFYCALNSTVDSMSFPFIFLFGHFWGLMTFIPLIYFMGRKRWKTGLATRVEIIKGKQVEDQHWEWRRIFLMTKVMARYIEHFFFPDKVYFFGKWCEKIRESRANWDYYHACNREFWISLAIFLATAFVSFMIHPVGAIWFFVLMGLHSQFKVLGQPFAQRYLYLPMIGLCVVLGTGLANHPDILFMIVGFYIYKAWTVIPNWKDQKTLLENEVLMNPERGGAYSALSQYYISKKKLIEYPHWEINLVSSHIRKAVLLEPESWVVWMNFTAYLIMIGKIEEGIKANERTIELMEKYATEREKPNIKGSREQLQWLKNLLVDMQKNAKHFGPKK